MWDLKNQDIHILLEVVSIKLSAANHMGEIESVERIRSGRPSAFMNSSASINFYLG